jgi:2-hydroxychromene-2-carboxylate isomerase
VKPRVEFLFDFGSPNAYLAHQIVPEIEHRTGVKFAYVPVLLGGIFKLTNNSSPMVAFGPVKNKLPYEMLETQRFIRRHNIAKFTFNPNFPINTLALMRGAVAAEMEGLLPAYVEAGFRFMWEEPRKMDDPEVFRAALEEAGLPAGRLVERSQSPEVKKRLMDNTEQAVARGAFGIPSFFVGGELFFGKDRLTAVEEEIRRAATGPG